MLAAVEMNRFGHLEIRAVNDRITRRVVRHLASFKVESDGSAYIQTDYDVDAFLADLPKRAARDIREGWPTRVRLDGYYFGCLIGWDAHYVV
jgi:hypothetical protein